MIDGEAVAKEIKAQLTEEVKALVEEHKASPCLAVILIGSRKDSQTYVRMKTKACLEVGIVTHQIDLPENASQEEAVEAVRKLNADPAVNGILVQLPLPKHIDERAVISALDPSKDVDGLHENSAGSLFQAGARARFVPCTPLGCLALLDRYEVPIAGQRAVVLGRSELVGKPMAMLLLSRDATVTVCHSKTKDLPSILQQADIVVVAIGKPFFVKGEWLKAGAVVIDVGINAVDDKSLKQGYRLVGDVDYASATKVAKAVTPVPRGVGPMTVAMLLKNTVKAFRAQHSQ